MSAHPSQFVSGHSRAQVAVGLLYANIALSALSLILSLVQIFILPGTQTADLIQLGELTWFDVLMVINGLLQFFVFIGAAVSFLMWLHRANRNLSPLGASHPEFSPGWAVGWFFIPLANIIVPYRVVKEIWVKSNPLLNEPGEESWQQSGSSSVLGWWWGIWLISNMIDQIVFRLALRAETPDELFNLAKLEVVAAAFNIIAAFLAIAVIKGIDKRQELKSKANRGSHLPPPPPTFAPQQT
jgi:hypothetical protein